MIGIGEMFGVKRCPPIITHFSYLQAKLAILNCSRVRIWSTRLIVNVIHLFLDLMSCNEHLARMILLVGLLVCRILT